MIINEANVKRKGLPKATSNNTPAALYQLALAQGICTTAFALGMLYCFGIYEAISACIGGLVALSANLYLAVKMHKAVLLQETNAKTEQQEPLGMLQRFYRFEVLKIVFTVTMFVIAVVVIQVSILPFIIAYVLAALVVTWLSLLVLGQQDEE